MSIHPEHYKDAYPGLDKNPGLIEIEPLSPNDRPWIEDLAGAEIGDEWYEKANTLIAIGSVDLRHTGGEELQTLSLAARKYFYGTLLGWDDPKHDLHSAYSKLQLNAKNAAGILIDSFIENQRIIYAAGIKNSVVTKKAPNILHCSAKGTQEKIDVLTGFGLDVPKVAKNAPTTLQLSPKKLDENITAINGHDFDGIKVMNTMSTVIAADKDDLARRVENIEAVIKILGWSHSARELIDKLPVVLALGDEKLMAHTRLFQAHGDKEYTLSEVANFLTATLSAHLLAVYESPAYTPSAVRKITSKNKAPECKAKLKDLLVNSPEEAELRIGRKVIRAFLRAEPKLLEQ